MTGRLVMSAAAVTLTGVNMIEEKIDSFAGLMSKLDRVRAETADVF